MEGDDAVTAETAIDNACDELKERATQVYEDIKADDSFASRPGGRQKPTQLDSIFAIVKGIDLLNENMTLLIDIIRVAVGS